MILTENVFFLQSPSTFKKNGKTNCRAVSKVIYTILLWLKEQHTYKSKSTDGFKNWIDGSINSYNPEITGLDFLKYDYHKLDRIKDCLWWKKSLFFNSLFHL